MNDHFYRNPTADKVCLQLIEECSINRSLCRRGAGLCGSHWWSQWLLQRLLWSFVGWRREELNWWTRLDWWTKLNWGPGWWCIIVSPVQWPFRVRYSSEAKRTSFWSGNSLHPWWAKVALVSYSVGPTLAIDCERIFAKLISDKRWACRNMTKFTS